MSALLALVCLGLLAPASARPASSGDTRTPLARVELTGPLTETRLEFPDGSGTRVTLDLARGERRTLTLPLPVPVGAEGATPELVVDGEGTARFVGWVGDDLERLSAEWERVPPGLRSRPRPPPPGEAAVPGPGLAALLIACGAFLLAMRWRRRGRVALLVGALGAAAAYAAAAPEPPPERERVLLDGSGASDAWLSIRVASERLTVAPTEAIRLETRPARAPLGVLVDEGPDGLRWTFAAPGAVLEVVATAPLARDALTRDANAMGALLETWVREPDGSWNRHGPWPRGAPLPEALPGPGEPPGWLNPALPMGVGILVGRREAPDPAGASVWLRVVGF